MLIIETEIKKSPIHGMGLFTSLALKKGQIIWVLHKNCDAIISLHEWQMLIKPAQDYLATYMYWSTKKKKYVACLDNGRFMNHADNPNTKTAFFNSLLDIPPDILETTRMSSLQWEMVDISEGFTVALSDIKAGEELTSNYDIDFPDEGGLQRPFLE